MMMGMMGLMESRLRLRSPFDTRTFAYQRVDKILIDPIFMCWIVAFIFFDSGQEYQLR